MKVVLGAVFSQNRQDSWRFVKVSSCASHRAQKNLPRVLQRQFSFVSTKTLVSCLHRWRILIPSFLFWSTQTNQSSDDIQSIAIAIATDYSNWIQPRIQPGTSNPFLATNYRQQKIQVCFLENEPTKEFLSTKLNRPA